MGIDKNQNIISDVDAAYVNEDENTNTGHGISTAGPIKDRDVSDKFSHANVDRVGGNIKKQLKVRKSKIFIAIINLKKPYLLKKILTTTLF